MSGDDTGNVLLTLNEMTWVAAPPTLREDHVDRGQSTRGRAVHNKAVVSGGDTRGAPLSSRRRARHCHLGLRALGNGREVRSRQVADYACRKLHHDLRWITSLRTDHRGHHHSGPRDRTVADHLRESWRRPDVVHGRQVDSQVAARTLTGTKRSQRNGCPCAQIVPFTSALVIIPENSSVR